MEEIRQRDEQLITLTASIQELLKPLEKSTRKAQDLDLIKAKLQEFVNIRDAFKIELRHQSPSDKKLYKQKLKNHNDTYDALKNEYEWKQTSNVSNELLGDVKTKIVDYDSAEGLMKHGLEIQDQSKDSLNRSISVVVQTKALGTETAQKLEQQTEQLGNVGNDLDKIDDILTRSNKIIRLIGRRIMTDKYVWVLIILIILAIVGIVLYKRYYNPDANVNVPDTLVKQ
jgi:flagellar hook-length control protein FliK